MACSTRSALPMARSSARSFSPAARAGRAPFACSAARRCGTWCISRCRSSPTIASASPSTSTTPSLELEFPSPYLNHQPTRLTIRTSDGHALSSRDIRTGYEEAFVEELKGFWSAIVEGKPVRNTAEHARRDMKLLAGLARFHLATTRKTTTTEVDREGSHRHQPDHLDQ